MIRELDRRDGQAGAELVLTIDMALQKFATERLAPEIGSVVVLDTASGAVLSQASTPSFDPNALSQGLSPAAWQALAQDRRAPLRNKAIAGEYAPGSTFKMIVALAALEAGVIDARSSFFCPGQLELGDGVFHCWKRHGHGHVQLHRGIVESCDVYFYELSRRVGIDRIAAMAKRFALGGKFELDVPGERPGLMPTKAWKQAMIGHAWTLGETLISGIGQGFVLATPLQLAVMMARLANGGRAITPFFARDRVADGRLAARPADGAADMGVDAHHLALVRKAMIGVTEEPRGTAYAVRLAMAGTAMGGKTGTAQVRRISQRQRDTGIQRNAKLPWRMRDHALFVGFAPAKAPRYAISVVVEHGGGGATVAAPIARDVMIETLKRDPARHAPGASVAGIRPAPGRDG